MKSPLFWKIFLSFWLTAVVINQASWLIYITIWDQHPSWEREISEAVAPVELAAAKAVVSGAGVGGLARLRSTLPDRGARVRVLRPGEQPDPVNDRTIRAPTADGTQIMLAYRLVRNERKSFDLIETFSRSTDYLLASLLGGIVFAALLAFYMMRPVRRLRDGFDALANGDLSVRLTPSIGKRRDELADLARHFDHMATRLEQLVTVRDQLLHDVSHELRSPLARLNLAIALLRRQPADPEPSLRRIEGEISRLDELVAELLSLARSESGSEAQDDYFDLVGLTWRIVSTLEVEALSIGARIVPTTGVEECVVHGSSELMRRAIENILRNAIRVSHAGDEISVAIRTLGNMIEVTIGDQGPGVPAKLLEKIFEPFNRGVADGSQGYGLGLTIARRAILSHHGSVYARNLEPQGLLVAISLPIAVTATID